MPTYAFKCPACGPLERWLPVDEVSQPQVCECGSPLARLYLAPATSSTRGLSEMDEGERTWHLNNKKWIESEATKGELEVRVQGPLELRPNLPSRHIPAG